MAAKLKAPPNNVYSDLISGHQQGYAKRLKYFPNPCLCILVISLLCWTIAKIYIYFPIYKF